MPEKLSPEERIILLNLARQSIQEAVQGKELPLPDRSCLPSSFLEDGVVFVTLTKHGRLRGCVGAMESYQALVADVREHAVAAALNDYRFLPVAPEEVPFLEIEISRLTPLQPLAYRTPEELLDCLRPGIDGVMIKDGPHRSTFLPQVWEKISTPAEFLSQLCMKMGASPDLWRCKPLQIFTYQVEEFHE